MDGVHVAIDLESLDDNAWIDSMRTRTVRESREFESFFDGTSGAVIPRIGDDIRRGRNNYYHPKLVSIGPYHSSGTGNSQLQAMEGFKRQCLNDLLARNSTPFERCIEAMREVEAEAKRCYPENHILSNHGRKFVEMMLLDASFIIEVFTKQSEHRHPSNFYSVAALLKRDLLLLENQLPFFVIKRLFDLTIEGSTGLTNLAIYFFNSSHGENREISSPQSSMRVHHLLHLYQSQFYPDSCPLNRPPNISSIPCATKLHVMGIDFKAASSGSILTDVKFDIKNRVMEIPHLSIGEDKVALFLNLIAFEQSNVHLGTHFTSYAVFMNYILSEAKDVEFLCDKGIIEHRLSNHQAMVNLFRSMCDGSFIDPSTTGVANILLKVKTFSSRWQAPPWWSSYFEDPITVIVSLLGGAGLWALTLIQTIYTVYSNYHSS